MEENGGNGFLHHSGMFLSGWVSQAKFVLATSISVPKVLLVQRRVAECVGQPLKMQPEY